MTHKGPTPLGHHDSKGWDPCESLGARIHWRRRRDSPRCLRQRSTAPRLRRSARDVPQARPALAGSNPLRRLRTKKRSLVGALLIFWRRRRDSNPRRTEALNGFRDRRIQPLCHPSVRVTWRPKAPRKVLAESQGFEPWRRFRRLHDFQSCSFGHSDNSP